MTFAGFANILGLWGLLSLPIIILLHLMRQRVRDQVVSSLSLWSFLETEVRGSRLRRIPISLILLLHLLIALLLSLAWARPQVIMTVAKQPQQHFVILLDNSASMRARDVAPNRFEQARTGALALLSRLQRDDSATLITFGARARLVADSRERGVEAMQRTLASLQAGEAQSLAFDSALALGKASISSLQDETLVSFHVFTDAAFPLPGSPLNEAEVIWYRIGTEAANQAVLDMEAEEVAPGTWQIFARLANFGNTAVNKQVTLFADMQQVEARTIELPPGATVAQIWELEGAPSNIRVQIDGADALVEDDFATMGLHGAQEITRVGLVAHEAGPLQRALEATRGVALQVMTPEEYVPGQSFDLLFFHGVTPAAWPLAPVVISAPPADGELIAVEGNATIRDVPIPGVDPLLSGVDFGGVRWGEVTVLQEAPPEFESLLQAGTRPLLLRGVQRGGAVFLLLADLESGNLSRHPAFPVLIANLVQSATRQGPPLSLSTGAPLPLPAAAVFPRLSVTLPDGDALQFGDQRPLALIETTRPGLYQMDMTSVGGAVSTAYTGVNAGSMSESALGPGQWVTQLPAAATQSAADNDLRTESQPADLMPWLLATVALLLIMEAFIAWR